MVVNDLPESHNHGAAAQALYGQPFGFTCKDVELLRIFARTAGRMGAIPACIDATSLANRIEALLPPEGAKE